MDMEIDKYHDDWLICTSQGNLSIHPELTVAIDRVINPPQWFGPKNITTVQAPAILSEKGNWSYGLR